MLSQVPHCRYSSNPLGEVICQLRFPEILSIEAVSPAVFQDAIRDIFPIYTRKEDLPPPKITGRPGHFITENPPSVINHQFSTMDQVWRVNLTGSFLSLTCNRYTCWGDFAARLDKPLAAFIQIYNPACFQRVGLRYVNFISRNTLHLEGVPFSELIAPCYLGPLMEEDVVESNVTRCTVDAELSLRGGCRAKIHAGPGIIRRPGMEDKEIKFIFDQDLYMSGQIPVNLSAGALQTLHSQATSIFRGAITDTLHHAMKPDR